MIRQILLVAFISGLAVLAFRDWYKSLCGLILLMAVVEHPDMPKSIFGVQGLNPWNILLVIILFAWAFNRSREGLYWDMPRLVAVVMGLYFSVIVVAFVRMMADMDGFYDYYALFGSPPPSQAATVSEFMVNCFKWVIPGLLLFDGCRDSSRFKLGILCLLGVYFLLGIQIIRWMPLSGALTGGELSTRSLKVLLNEIGFHRVNLSMMMAGAFWAILSTVVLAGTKPQKLMISAAALTVLFAQALTAGRAGYATWAVVGTIACVFKWRKMLLVIPVILFAVVSFVPGVAERMLQGVSTPTGEEFIGGEISTSLDLSGDDVDLYVVTAGRNLAWPHVIEKIEESLFVGYGREAMKRTGIAQFMMLTYRESFPHPHSAYLETLLDNGVIGSLPIFLFYLMIVKYSVSLFLDTRSPTLMAGGGVCLFLVLALLVASFGSQTFYPREGAVGMWCAIGLMLRLCVQRERVEEKMTGAALPESIDQLLWAEERA